jgi:hypothetical protein
LDLSIYKGRADCSVFNYFLFLAIDTFTYSLKEGNGGLTSILGQQVRRSLFTFATKEYKYISKTVNQNKVKFLNKINYGIII